MSTLLVIDTSPSRGAVSRRLTQRFVAEWTESNPGGTVLRQDVGTNAPDQLNDELIEALRRNPESVNEYQAKALAASDTMIDEIVRADMIVIGAPMHNFTITGPFRTWLDHVARPGKTFGFNETGAFGLLEDKPVYVLSTRGGDYGNGDPSEPHPADFQSNYMRHIFGFMGLRSLSIIAANGLDMGDEPRAAGIDEAEHKIRAIFAD